MAKLKVSDLLVLSATTDEPARHVEQLLKWHHDRMDAIVRVALGAFAAALVAFAAASFRSDATITVWHIGGLAMVAAVSVGLSAHAVRSIRQVDAEYVEALRILRELEPLIPLLRARS